MAAPDDRHAERPHARDQPGGLRVVQDDDVARAPGARRARRRSARARPRRARVPPRPSGPPSPGHAVQPVVQALREREERRVGRDHHPARVDAAAARVGEQGDEQLGHAAAARGRVDVPDPAAGRACAAPVAVRDGPPRRRPGRARGRRRRAAASRPGPRRVLMYQRHGGADEGVRGFGRGDVSLGHGAGEALAERGGKRVQRDGAGDRGERAEQRRARQRPAEVLARQLGRGDGDQPPARHRHVARRVQEHAAVGEAGEDVREVQERRVLDDQRVRADDRLARADRRVADPAERHHRRAGALGAEARERLGMAAVEEGGHRQSSAAVTTPCPPRPWKRTWSTSGNGRAPGPSRASARATRAGA